MRTGTIFSQVRTSTGLIVMLGRNSPRCTADDSVATRDDMWYYCIYAVQIFSANISDKHRWSKYSTTISLCEGERNNVQDRSNSTDCQLKGAR